jgi:hypothetical protein
MNSPEAKPVEQRLWFRVALDVSVVAVVAMVAWIVWSVFWADDHKIVRYKYGVEDCEQIFPSKIAAIDPNTRYEVLSIYEDDSMRKEIICGDFHSTDKLKRGTFSFYSELGTMEISISEGSRTRVYHCTADGDPVLTYDSNTKEKGTEAVKEKNTSP